MRANNNMTLMQEKSAHYIVHDGESTFPVPKAGLSDEMHAKIRALPRAEGHADGAQIPDMNALPDMRGGAGGASGSSNPAMAPPIPQSPNTAGWSLNPLPGIQQGLGALLPAKGSGTGMSTPVGYVQSGESPEAAAKRLGGHYVDAKEKLANPSLEDFAHGAEKGDEKSEAEHRDTYAGLTPKGEAPAAGESPDTKAKPPPVRGGGGAPMPKAPGAPESVEPELRAAYDAQKAGEAANLQATTEAARLQAAAANETVNVNKAYALREQEAAQRAQLRMTEAMTRVKAAQDDMAHVDTNVDPGRYMANMSLPGKILAGIGLALGAVGAGSDGVNRAVGVLQQGIDRDIDAQKATAQLRMGKAKEGIAGAQSYYSMMKEATGDDVAATHAAKIAMLDNVQAKLKASLIGVTNQQALANGQVLMAKLDQQKADEAGKLRNQVATTAQAGATIGETMRHNRVGESLEAAKANKDSNNTFTGGTDALVDASKLWEKAGGVSGSVTKHIAGTAANDWDNQVAGFAQPVATQLNGGKAPKPALIEWVQKNALPQSGDTLDDGRDRLKRASSNLQAALKTRPDLLGEVGQ